MGDISPHLSRVEVTCQCGCGYDQVAPEFVQKFEVARVDFGYPIFFSSVCRCHDHNEDEGGVDDSAHTYGEAGDMKCRKDRRLKLVRCLIDAGFHGIGVYEWGIHADCSTTKPRPRIW